MHRQEHDRPSHRQLTRRGFLGGVAASATAAILAACGSGKATTNPAATTSGPIATTVTGQATAAATAKPAGAASATTGGTAQAAVSSATTNQDAGSLTMLSTQFSPIDQAEKFRKTILANFKGKVEFLPQEYGPFNDRIRAEEQANKVTVSILGGLHGDFAAFVKDGLLQDLSPLMSKLSDRGFPKSFVDLARVGTDKTYYIPWMQATYIMVANKKAMQYLPQGANIDSLTYAQLKDWGAAIQKGAGQRRLGYPAGPKGLIHRFVQGYLYPSYTKSTVVEFKSSDAVGMWNDFKDIWAYVNPQSTSYSGMGDPLQAEEVWVAWDHIAGFINVLQDRPNDFVAFPAPAGPKGRGIMPVLAGLAIPKGAPNQQGAELLIQYLTQPQQQIATAKEEGFFPVTNASIPSDLSPGIKLEADAIQKQSSAPDAVTTLLPVGLGAKNGEFNQAYADTFSRIVLKNESIQTVLNDEAKIIQADLNETNAPCWAPDPTGTGTCQIK